MNGKKSIVAILAALFIGVTVSAQVKDTMFLVNGQVLIGELKSIVLGKVEFDADGIDLVSVKVNKIRTITARKHFYRVETIDRKFFYTQLQASTPGNIYINENDLQVEISLEKIGNLIPLKGKRGGLFEGNLSAGYSYSRSSNVGQLNGDFSIGYLTRRIELFMPGSIIMSQTDSNFSSDNASLGIYGTYLFTSLWQGNTLVKYQRNLQLGLARRYQEGLAIGLRFVSTAHVRTKALTGVVLNQEKNTEGVESVTQAEVPVIVLFNFYYFKKPDISLSSIQSLFVSITQGGRIRHDGEINLKWKIIEDLSVSIKVYDNYDNMPPVETASNLDYGVVFGLSYEF